MDTKSGLTVRQTVRYELKLRAVLEIASEHSGQVRMSVGGVARTEGIDLKTVDFSEGGIGLMSDIFLPRGCLARVKVFEGEGQEETVVLDARVRIRRVIMTDPKPTYFLGTAFVDPGPRLQQQLERLIRIAGTGGETASTAA